MRILMISTILINSFNNYEMLGNLCISFFNFFEEYISSTFHFVQIDFWIKFLNFPFNIISNVVIMFLIELDIRLDDPIVSFFYFTGIGYQWIKSKERIILQEILQVDVLLNHP
jgi:hypothetical protein